MAVSPDLARWQALDARHHLHPFTTHSELAAKGTRVITRAEGVYIFDAAGERILDGMSGLWCVQVGHGRARLAEAAARQMRELAYYNSFFQCTTVPAVELAAKLASILPGGIERVHFLSSGSEANETVAKSVHYYWNLRGRPEKKAIITRRLGYHGGLTASASMTGMDFMHAMFDLPLPGYHYVMPPYHFAHGEGMDPAEFGLHAARELERKIIELGPDKVAAFVGEPIQGAGGVIIPPDTYWPEVERICRRHDVLLVADEVICGFGRTGRWWGCETFGFTPDIVTMAKGITSGYVPLAAVAYGPRLGEVLGAAEKEFAHGVTYAGHPVACAVALENIAIMEEEGLATRAAGPVGACFRRALQSLADHPLVGEVRARGLIGCVELVAAKRPRRLFEPAGRVGTICRDLCVEHGLVMRAIRDGMVLAPPLTITEAEIDEIAVKARRALDATADVLAR